MANDEQKLSDAEKDAIVAKSAPIDFTPGSKAKVADATGTVDTLATEAGAKKAVGATI